MKKMIVLASAMFLIAGMVFAQTPQTPAKSTTTTTTATSTEKKDDKANCDPKTAKNCSASKSCCSHGSKPSSSTDKKETAPEKK